MKWLENWWLRWLRNPPSGNFLHVSLILFPMRFLMFHLLFPQFLWVFPLFPLLFLPVSYFRSYAKIMPCRNWVEEDEINVSKTSHILPCYPYRMFNCLLHSSLTRKYKHENFKLHSSNLFYFFCFHCSYFQKQLFRRATRNFSGQGRFCEIRALR